MRAPRCNALLELGAIPVINENDTVATAEIRYGDNDRLAAARRADGQRRLPGAAVGCRRLVFGGSEPRIQRAEFFAEVRGITPRIEAMAGGSASDVGSGGMATKIVAARIALDAGCHMCIASGHPLNPLKKVERRRALHLVHPGRDARDRAQAVDRGRVEAGRRADHRCGRGGRVAARPQPAAGRRDGCHRQLRARRCGGRGRTDGRVIARGLTAYSSGDVARIMGRRSSEIEQLVGFRGRDEVVHRDDLVLRAGAEEIGSSRADEQRHGGGSMARISTLVMAGLGRAAAASRAALALSIAARSATRRCWPRHGPSARRPRPILAANAQGHGGRARARPVGGDAGPPAAATTSASNRWPRASSRSRPCRIPSAASRRNGRAPMAW